VQQLRISLIVGYFSCCMISWCIALCWNDEIKSVSLLLCLCLCLGSATEALARKLLNPVKPWNPVSIDRVTHGGVMTSVTSGAPSLPKVFIQATSCTELPAHVGRCCACVSVEATQDVRTNAVANCRFYAFRGFYITLFIYFLIIVF
jgi:hypothetical protein